MAKALDFDNPLKIVIVLGMVFMWLFWLGQTNTSINAIGGNTTIVGKFCCASTSAYGATSWLLWIVMGPFALLMFVNWVAHKSGEGDVDVGAMASEGEDDMEGGILGRARRLHSQRIARRRHHSLTDSFEGLDEEDTS